MNRNTDGFTMIELMIVVVVLAILSSIAIPSYRDYVFKSRRADAKAGMMNLSLAQEKWHVNNISYTGTLANLGASTSPEGYYNLSVVSWSQTGYVLQATPTGVQTGDKCGSYQINQSGVKSNYGYLYPTTYPCGW